MYFDIYNLLHEYIYGLATTLTEWQDLTLTILATCGVLFVVSIPFVIVWRVIKLVA